MKDVVTTAQVFPAQVLPAQVLTGQVFTAQVFTAQVLVTGFGAFPGARTNPTLQMLEKLCRRRARLARLDIALEVVELPVQFDGIAAALASATARGRPDAILHLGLAGRRRTIGVETRALNRAGLQSDAGGRRLTRSTVVSGAPMILRATYPARRIEMAIRRQGIPVERSIDAGNYVCNATLYRSLFTHAADVVGFLHVPKPRASRPLRRGRRPRPTFDQLAEAAFAAILVMTRPAALRAHRPAGVPKVPPPDGARTDPGPPARARVAARPEA